MRKANSIIDNRGITLVALVVTIIVLLILTGVCFKKISEQNKMINLSKEMGERVEQAKSDELAEIEDVRSLLNKDNLDSEGDGDSNIEESIPEGMVVKIGENYYETLQEAISAVPDNIQTEIILVDNVSESINIESNKNILLNLNGKTVSSNATNVATITNYGTLIMNGEGTIFSENTAALQNSEGILIIDGDFSFSNNNTTYAAVYNSVYSSETGEMRITGGTINLEIGDYSKSGIESYGPLTITGGVINATNCCAIYNAQGTLDITGDVSINSSWSTINTYNGTVTITGAVITSEDQKAINSNLGQIIINEGTTVTNKEDGVDTITVVEADLVINGGEITAGNSWAINNMNGGTVTINGGTITNNSASYGAISNVAGCTLKITGGTIQNTYATNGVILNYGTTEISGGSIIGNNYFVIGNLSGGTLTMSAGTITNQSDGYATLYNNSGSVTITGGTIKNFSTSTSAYEISDNTNTMNIDSTVLESLRVTYR